MARIITAVWLALSVAAAQPGGTIGAFLHPGLNQSQADLEHLKGKVLRGEQPWKGAFDRLKAEANAVVAVEPVAHVSQGGYGANDLGGGHLTATSRTAYDCALIWYITGDKNYADAAIRILNSWSGALTDFDENNAKLIASGSANHLCQAAEILRYSSSGWRQDNIRGFEEMLLTVIYPLLRFYYPEANGNWDAYITRAILAIAIFTDNRPMFDNAIAHFLFAPVNGSLFKYIYPNGQCQESTRDQGHVRMGLSAYANIAQIAYTQGMDLFSIADNRLALGFEYTTGFLLGNKVHSYGPISEVKKELGDDYESVLHHYSALGIDLPNTRRAAELRRPNASRDLLTAVRAEDARRRTPSRRVVTHPVVKPTGAMEGSRQQPPAGAIGVPPHQSIQEALDAAAGKGGWVVATAGKHKLPRTLRVPSGVHLAGEGLSTVLCNEVQARQKTGSWNSIRM